MKRPLSPPHEAPAPKPLRLGPGIIPSPDQLRERWIWQHPDWPRFTWNWERLVEPLGDARQALGRLQMAGKVLDPAATRAVLAEVLALEGISSSAIAQTDRARLDGQRSGWSEWG